jgi:ring-1,2-phenylacetyl-CoA epoxidase subunit PaaE
MLSHGIPEGRVHFELFTSPGKKGETPIKLEEDATISSIVSIILDGAQLDLALNSGGESILDTAQKAGADLPFACKGGVCSTCKAKILEGTAQMDVNYALEKDEIDAGYILTCQAHPTSERLIVSFDE